MPFIELNHPVHDRMPVLPWLPEPRIGPILTHEESRERYEGQAEFFLGKVDMPGNTGTYLDAPFHRFREGGDLASLPLQAVAGLPGVLLDASGTEEREIRLSVDPRDVSGRAVLIRTGWDERWGTDGFWEPGPYLGGQLVEDLVAAKPALVGVDFANVDDTGDPSRPAHTRLLEEGILIVEALCNLGQLPREGFRFFAVPPRIVGGASFTVRAFAELS